MIKESLHILRALLIGIGLGFALRSFVSMPTDKKNDLSKYSAGCRDGRISLIEYIYENKPEPNCDDLSKAYFKELK